MNTAFRTVRFNLGWTITDTDEAALPAGAWTDSLRQNGEATTTAGVAELTGLDAEDQVRTNKDMGLRNLPSKSWDVNQGWVLAANIAADLTAWTRLLGLHDQPDLAHAEPETLRYRLLHLPAILSSHARKRTLKISETWPFTDAFLLCWQRLSALPAPT